MGTFHTRVISYWKQLKRVGTRITHFAHFYSSLLKNKQTTKQCLELRAKVSPILLKTAKTTSNPYRETGVPLVTCTISLWCKVLGHFKSQFFPTVKGSARADWWKSRASTYHSHVTGDVLILLGFTVLAHFPLQHS